MLLSNTGRCGSTALVQVFEAIPNALVLSEPDAFSLALMLFNSGKTTNEQDESILRSIMNVQCKNLKTKKVDLMVLKTRGSCIQQIRKISSLSKLAKHIFMYRHPKSTILSFWSAFGFIIKSFLSKRMLAVFLPIPETREHHSITRTCSYVGTALYFLLRVSK